MISSSQYIGYSSELWHHKHNRIRTHYRSYSISNIWFYNSSSLYCEVFCTLKFDWFLWHTCCTIRSHDLVLDKCSSPNSFCICLRIVNSGNDLSKNWIDPFLRLLCLRIQARDVCRTRFWLISFCSFCGTILNNPHRHKSKIPYSHPFFYTLCNI